MMRTGLVGLLDSIDHPARCDHHADDRAVKVEIEVPSVVEEYASSNVRSTKLGGKLIRTMAWNVSDVYQGIRKALHVFGKYSR